MTAFEAVESAQNVMSKPELIAWVAGVATGVATVLTTALTFWFRFLDKPRVSWAIAHGRSKWERDEYGGGDYLPTAHVSISNIGDGQAKLVSVIGIDCEIFAILDASNRRDGRFPLIPPGSEIDVHARVMSTRWATSQILLTWASPGLFGVKLRSRLEVFQLQHYLDEPEFRVAETNQVTGVIEVSMRTPTEDVRKRIQAEDKQLESRETVVLAKTNPSEHRAQLRRLSKAGWGWQKLNMKPAKESQTA